MNSAKTKYTVQHRELRPGKPALGSVALLPWDIEIFGFPVGEYQCGDREALAAAVVEVRNALTAWARQEAIAVCAASVPASNRELIALLPKFGFAFIDFCVQVTLPGLQAARIQASRYQLRRAQPPDADRIRQIACGAFQFGRYHVDPAFPRELANARYRQWMENALAESADCTLIYVIEDETGVQGFYHVIVDDGTADLRLAAVDISMQGTLIGFDLYAGTLLRLKEAGVRQVVSKISCANTPVMNVYSALGFRFSRPEAVFHWHPKHRAGGQEAAGA
jgi:hypothetical protein